MAEPPSLEPLRLEPLPLRPSKKRPGQSTPPSSRSRSHPQRRLSRGEKIFNTLLFSWLFYIAFIVTTNTPPFWSSHATDTPALSPPDEFQNITVLPTEPAIMSSTEQT